MNNSKLAFVWIILSATGFVSADEIDFNRDIRPILSDQCFSCHGPDESSREADLRLDDENDAKLDRDGYHVIDIAKPASSELLNRIFSTDEDELMPPPDFGRKLSAEQKKLLKKWIEQGAKWSGHWAYVPPTKTKVPVSDSSWPKTSIDHFVLQKLTQKGMEPVGDADKIVLLRRLYFDLIGLPPTQKDVDDFLKDNSRKAFENVVTKLLDSEHFGERMAIYWLDLVRYADTVGYHGDQDHNISPYRDWVIQAFNSNMPFDQFTREQIAGDLIPDAEQSQLVASGYNRLLQTTHEGGLQPKEYRAMYAADRVRNVSAVWMGGTLGCAQCHDHKYDPYTMKDFYAMAAFFADIDDEQHFKSGTNSLPTRRNPEIRVLTNVQKAELSKLKSLKSRLTQQKTASDDETVKKKIADELKKVAQNIAAIEKSARMTMVTKALAKPRTTRILPRGNFLDESGPIVEPAVPDFMKELGLQELDSRSSRLDLANWLTDGKRPSGHLTARVFVNRMWYLLFGKGLAPDLADFGGQGLPPNHPELLDNLALSFVESGWNVKQLLSEMVMSRTYQLSSNPSASLLEKDPENLWFARQSRHRISAEMIRDNALAVSGLLIKKIGGGSVKPYQPAGYYRHLNFPTRKYAHHSDDRQYQRGVYVHWQRQFLHPMMRAFDAPRREECTAERPRSNTPNAALVLLNDPTFVESARVFAERIISKETEIEKQIELAFQVALSRKPDEFESELLKSLYAANLAIYKNDLESAQQLLAIGMKKYDGTLDVASLASFTQVTRALFNLDEFVTRR